MQAILPQKLTPQSIARFSRPEIEKLADTELACLVRSARLPFLTPPDVARLTFLGRDSLLRLGFLAREFCRNQERDTRWSALSE